MKKKETKDISISIRDRLKNLAKKQNIPFDYILRLYAMVQFLHRVSLSPHKDKFIIKGGLLIYAHNLPIFRTTKDIDILFTQYESREQLVKTLKDIRSITINDGLVFDMSKYDIEERDVDSANPSYRVKFHANLSKAKIPMIIDVGIGDEIYPQARLIQIPPILEGLTSSENYVYPLESVLSEKLQTTARFGHSFSRLKDILDVWLIIKHFSIFGRNLRIAVKRTFSNRNTELSSLKSILQSELTEGTERHKQWNALIGSINPKMDIPSYKDAVSTIQKFIKPVVKSLLQKKHFNMKWNPIQMKWK